MKELRYLAPWLQAQRPAVWDAACLALRNLGLERPEGLRWLIAEANPWYQAAWLALACEQGAQVFLADPAWTEVQWQQAEAICQPHAACRAGTWTRLTPAATPELDEASCIGIPTGGSRSKLRFALHTPATLNQAVNGYAQWMTQILPGKALVFDVLPPHHVSGLMPVLRAAAMSDDLWVGSYRDLANVDMLEIPAGGRRLVVSLVPTQLKRLVESRAGRAVLRRFDCIFVGGAGLPEALAQEARSLGLRLCPVYGMTETAAMVAALAPSDFLAGRSGVGSALPHARLYLANPEFAGIATRGRLSLESEAVCFGYLPQQNDFQRHPYLTEDCAEKREDAWHVLGRLDDVIISGGENINLGALTEALSGDAELSDLHLIAQPDPEWGQRMVAFVVPSAWPEDLQAFQHRLRARWKTRLPAWQLPKDIILVARIPRTAVGKISQAELLRAYKP